MFFTSYNFQVSDNASEYINVHFVFTGKRSSWAIKHVR